MLKSLTAAFVAASLIGLAACGQTNSTSSDTTYSTTAAPTDTSMSTSTPTDTSMGTSTTSTSTSTTTGH